MGILDLIGAAFSIIAAVTPTLVAYYVGQSKQRDAMRDLGLSELNAADSRMFPRSTL